jgi:hypothetical protein
MPTHCPSQGQWVGNDREMPLSKQPGSYLQNGFSKKAIDRKQLNKINVPE